MKAKRQKKPADAPRQGSRAASAKPGAAVVPMRKPAPLFAGVAVGYDEATGSATVRVGSTDAPARLAPGVSPIVIMGAVARQETVVITEDETGFCIVGALRTAPTPGVDKADEYVVEARRIRIEADYETSIVSGAAHVVIRALGQIETLAKDITTRASGVQKLIGRMLHLN